MDLLPPEIILEILKFCDPLSYLTFISTCRSIYSCATNSQKAYRCSRLELKLANFKLIYKSVILYNICRALLDKNHKFTDKVDFVHLDHLFYATDPSGEEIENWTDMMSELDHCLITFVREKYYALHKNRFLVYLKSGVIVKPSDVEFMDFLQNVCGFRHVIFLNGIEFAQKSGVNLDILRDIFLK